MVKALVISMFAMLSVAYAATCPVCGESAGVYGPGIYSSDQCAIVCSRHGYTKVPVNLCSWQGRNDFCLCK